MLAGPFGHARSSAPRAIGLILVGADDLSPGPGRQLLVNAELGGAELVDRPVRVADRRGGRAVGDRVAAGVGGGPADAPGVDRGLEEADRAVAEGEVGATGMQAVRRGRGVEAERAVGLGGVRL